MNETPPPDSPGTGADDAAMLAQIDAELAAERLARPRAGQRLTGLVLLLGGLIGWIASLTHLRKQQIRQSEMAEVIRPELRLEPVDGPVQGRDHDPGIVDEEIDRIGEVRSEVAHRGEIGEIEVAHLGAAGHRLRGGLTLRTIAHGQDDMSAPARQNPGSDPTEPAVRTGDEGRAVSEIGDAEVDRRSHDAILEFRPGSQLSGRTAEAPNLLG